MRLGVLRPLQEPLGCLVLYGGVRQPVQDPRLPAAQRHLGSLAPPAETAASPPHHRTRHRSHGGNCGGSGSRPACVFDGCGAAGSPWASRLAPAAVANSRARLSICRLGGRRARFCPLVLLSQAYPAHNTPGVEVAGDLALIVMPRHQHDDPPIVDIFQVYGCGGSEIAREGLRGLKHHLLPDPGLGDPFFGGAWPLPVHHAVPSSIRSCKGRIPLPIPLGPLMDRSSEPTEDWSLYREGKDPGSRTTDLLPRLATLRRDGDLIALHPRSFLAADLRGRDLRPLPSMLAAQLVCRVLAGAHGLFTLPQR